MVTNRCFRFQPQLESWSEVGGMLRDREYHCSAALKGCLYCISGDSAEKFDPNSGAWTLIPPLPSNCENLQAVGCKVTLGNEFLILLLDNFLEIKIFCPNKI